MSFEKKGEDFDQLPETWVIFITENDVMGKGRPLYPIERCFLETGEKFEDGSHILYVNSAYRGDTPIWGDARFFLYRCSGYVLEDRTVTMEKLAEFVGLSVDEVKN